MVRKCTFILLVFIFFSLFSGIRTLHAEVLTSTNFNILDPVISVPGGRSTSTNFVVLQAYNQIGIGTSTATSFQINPGFLAFPTITVPAVSPTAGDTQVDLSWTSSTGALGWTVSGYTVGRSTVSGGPYFYTSVGNVTSSTRSGLTNGTTYYFVILPEDAFGNTIATSTEVSATPAAAAPPPPPPSGGGGGGIITPATGVTFEGRAYPLSTVTVLKDGQIAITTIAGPDANFSIALTGLTSGNYLFSLYGEDSALRRSTLFTFPIFITTGATTKISGIFIAPTIDVDKSEVRRGDNIAIFGQSSPNSQITIEVNSHETLFLNTASDEDGIYLYNLDTSPLEIEQHFTKSKAAYNGEISSFSKSVGFVVGTRNVVRAVEPVCGKADLNCDRRVNLVDFSIAAFWYKRPISAEFAIKEAERLSGDGKVDLVDFSIMAFHWTG